MYILAFRLLRFSRLNISQDKSVIRFKHFSPTQSTCSRLCNLISLLPLGITCLRNSNTINIWVKIASHQCCLFLKTELYESCQTSQTIAYPKLNLLNCSCKHIHLSVLARSLRWLISFWEGRRQSDGATYLVKWISLKGMARG